MVIIMIIMVIIMIIMVINVVIIAELVVQDEDAVAIFEALCILREWNPEWKPLFFMTDFDYKEINAIESG